MVGDEARFLGAAAAGGDDRGTDRAQTIRTMAHALEGSLSATCDDVRRRRADATPGRARRQDDDFA
jgi:hypothetical protein